MFLKSLTAWEIFFIFYAVPSYAIVALALCALGSTYASIWILVGQRAEWFDQSVYRLWDQHREEMSKLIAPVARGLIGFGTTLFITVFTAFALLYTLPRRGRQLVSALYVLMLIAHLVTMSVYYIKRPILLSVDESVFNQQVRSFTSVENGDSISLFQHDFMTTYECCGYRNGSDFSHPDALFSHREVIDGQVLTGLQTPVSCCRTTSNLDPNSCPQVFDADNSYIEIGCEGVLKRMLNQWTDRILFVTLPALLLNADTII